MGRLGNNISAGCRPLGEHLLGNWTLFADGVALGDAPSLTARLARADGVSLGEALSLAAHLSPADGVALDEAVLSTFTAHLSPSDGVALGDAPSLAVCLARADGVSLGEALSLAAYLSPSDGVALGDAPSLAVRLARADGVALGEALALAACLLPADGVALEDALALAARLARADSVTLGDALALAARLARADSVTLGDALALTARLSLADGVSLGDVASFLLYQLLQFTDGVALGDAPSLAVRLAQADGVALGDALALAACLLPADGVALGDAVLSTFTLGHLIEIQAEAQNASADVVIHLAQGDRLPYLVFVFINSDGNQQTYDAAAIITLRMRAPGASGYKINAVCERLDNGWYLYTLGATDTDISGEFQANLLIEIDGCVTTSELFMVRIRDVFAPAAPDAPAEAEELVSTRSINLQPEAEDAITDVVVHLAQGDRLPYLLFSLTHHDGTIININEADQVSLRLWSRDGDVYLINAQCTALGAGRYLYMLQEADTATAGEYYAHLTVQQANGHAYTSELFVVRIREDL